MTTRLQRSPRAQAPNVTSPFARQGRDGDGSASAGLDHSRSRWILPGRSRSVGGRLESRKALGAVVRNRVPTNLRQSAARLVKAVADKHRGISKDLVEVLVVGSQPAVAGSAADEPVDGAEGTVARYRVV